MYIPEYFEMKDEEEVFAFIEAKAFGQLISRLRSRLTSTHMPFLLSPDRTRIMGHLARQNPQHSELADQEVLITLQGPHGYISPSWYASPSVPTWNYQAVHIYGTCAVIENADWLRDLVDSLSSKYEASAAEPWELKYADSMLGAIVGVDVRINEIQCKYKLSQNRSRHDRQRVMEQLRAAGSKELADSMEQNEH